MASNTNDRSEKGVSLARGPALILGAVLLVAGLYFIYKLHSFPKLSQFPSGTAHVEGKAFLGIFGANGWSGELTAAAGGLLLFGAAQHLVAKTMSLIVGVVFAVIAVIALVHHHSALGLFAANIWTIILWGGSAALLLINALLPRTAGSSDTPSDAAPQYPRRRGVVATPVPTGTTAASPSASGESAPVRSTSPVQTDTSTIIPDRPAVRIKPTDGSVHNDEDAGVS